MLGVTKMSLGRLIGGRGRSLLSKYKPSSSNIYGFANFNPVKFLHASRCSHFGETAETTYYEVENKAKAGSNSGSLKLQMENAKKGNEVEVEVKEKLTILTKGDFVNISDLLFTKNRDYLIRCNNGKQVKAEQLEGKVVVIYFGSIFDMYRDNLTSLKHLYNDLEPNNCFEVVFVELHDVDDSFKHEIPYTPCQGEGEDFKDVFSTMPWTAIPLSDMASRIYLKQRFGLPDRLYSGSSFIVDSTGLILQCRNDTWNMFPNYGAEGYPFSDERINFLKSEDAETVRQPSLKKLLASLDYLISNKGDKVPIHTLEDKVVALYMYSERNARNKITTAKLKMAYEELAMNNIEFEVVLIYVSDTDEETFWNTFKTMPWLALPFRDNSYTKLKRIFSYPWDYLWLGDEFVLIVIGPHMEFIEPFGDFIFWNSGTPAYPFSRERVAKLLTEEYKERKLEMLLDQNNDFGKKYGSQAQFTQLAGKRVILLCGSSQEPSDFLQKLKKIYIKFKGTEKEFEVIQLTNEENYFPDVPWFVQPLDKYNKMLYDRYYYFNTDARSDYSLTAYDQDGRVVRETCYPTVESEKFPFYADDFEMDVLKDLDTMFGSIQYRGVSYPEWMFGTKRDVQQLDYC